jgi:DNA-directed RNA polymerase specialized sigma24 family protein
VQSPIYQVEVSFATLPDDTKSQVYRVAYGTTGQRDDADEVAQQAFVNAYFSIKDFRWAWFSLHLDLSHGRQRGLRIPPEQTC